MSLLGDIAAALSEGIGGGMIANAQWGIEEDKQAKKEAADKALLQEQMKRYDADRESRDKYYAALMEESKAERAARAEQSRLDRESNERIAGMRERSSGGSGNISTVFKGLNLIDDKVTGYDKSISDLVKLRSEEMDPAKQAQIDAQIDFFKQQRQNFITSPAVLKVLDSSGEYGQLYKSSLFGVEPDNNGEQKPEYAIPMSLVVPPPRAVTKQAEGVGSGLLTKLKELDAGSGGQAPATQEQPGKESDLSSYAERMRQGQPVAEKPDWDSIKAPQGGWRSPVKTKEVQYPNGQKGYTLEWAN